MSKSVQKQAAQDATEYAAAYMSIGEGAGNRRKLIEGTVGYKMEFVPGYREAFEKAHGHQDMAKHAENARKGNRRAHLNNAARRNVRAVADGKLQNADLGVIVLIVGGIVAHRTGYDKKAVKFVKTKYSDIKRKYKKTNGDTVHNITDAR